jgi:hypothetical protein
VGHYWFKVIDAAPFAGVALSFVFSAGPDNRRQTSDDRMQIPGVAGQHLARRGTLLRAARRPLGDLSDLPKPLCNRLHLPDFRDQGSGIWDSEP